MLLNSLQKPRKISSPADLLTAGTSVRPSGRFPSLRNWNSPVGSFVTGKPAEVPSNQAVQGMMSSCPARGFLADKAVNPTGVNHRAAVTLMRDAQIQPEPQANRNSDCVVV